MTIGPPGQAWAAANNLRSAIAETAGEVRAPLQGHLVALELHAAHMVRAVAPVVVREDDQVLIKGALPRALPLLMPPSIGHLPLPLPLPRQCLAA